MDLNRQLTSHTLIIQNMSTHHLPSQDDINQLPPDGGENYNRLIFQQSIYLKSHAHQKINWYPWGQDAFDLAKITNKPLFLSIGYSSCHWCHVMSDKTFDLDDIATLLNTNFVPIKIDRDEHPDIDQIYMAATQLLTQRGGWPNSVFCVPTGQPFFAGTYFPPDDHPNGPGFRTLLTQLSDAWKNNKPAIEEQAKELDSVIKKMNTTHRDPNLSNALRSHFTRVLHSFSQQYDPTFGGFGNAPKFPPYQKLRLCLQQTDAESSSMVHNTLESMALSGLYDHVEGGFHRYSTDVEWHCPHFEKMLVDNAQMIELYSLAHKHTPNPLFQRIVDDTIQHLDVSWKLDSGFYLNSIDADSDGEEGQYYVISSNELSTLFKASELKKITAYFQITDSGNMRDEATGNDTGYNILHPIEKNPPFDLHQFQQTLKQFRSTQRNHPTKDNAISIAGNALLAKGLVIAASTFDNKTWEKLAKNLLDNLCKKITTDLSNVYLHDMVYTLDALTTAHQLFSDNNLSKIITIWKELIDRFYDQAHGGCWFSQDSHKTPISRIKEIYDHAIPSPNGCLISIAIQLYNITKKTQYYAIAMDSISAFMASALNTIEGCETYWLGIHAYWSLFSIPSLPIQFYSCKKISDNTINIHLDMEIPNSHFIAQPDHINILNAVGNYNWTSILMNPIKSRRMAWSNDIVKCATGSVRLTGACHLETMPDELIIELSTCSDTECFPAQTLTLPIT